MSIFETLQGRRSQVVASTRRSSLLGTVILESLSTPGVTEKGRAWRAFF